jgi:hypothetical protein
MGWAEVFQHKLDCYPILSIFSLKATNWQDPYRCNSDSCPRSFPFIFTTTSWQGRSQVNWVECWTYKSWFCHSYTARKLTPIRWRLVAILLQHLSVMLLQSPRLLRLMPVVKQQQNMRTSLLADEFLDLFHVTFNVRDCSSVDLVLPVL